MNSFWNWWNSLTPTVQEGIVIGLITSVVGGLILYIFTGFWKLVGKAALGILKLIQRLLNWILPLAPASKPAIEASEIKPDTTAALPLQTPAPLSEPQETTTHEHVSLIPRPPLVGFVARHDAQGTNIVARLKEELAPGRNQLVTLSGFGGMGKTTLAAEAARALLAAYDGCVVWSSADGRADFTLLALLDDIATQLGRADLRTLAPAFKEEQVRALVADPATFVVLDNCETISVEERKRIEAWFAQTQCSALFTSRQKIDKTVFIPISAMLPKEAEEFLEKLAGQTQDPQIFTPDVRLRVYETAEANPSVMQWVVGQIDGAREPDTVFKELAEGEGDAAERVFDRSFKLPQLGDDGRDVLLSLSLFASSASREALAAVAGFGDDWTKRLDEAVKNLHALWLVKGLDANRRFTVEGLTRSMAAARLSRDPRADELRRRFVAYFLRYAEEHRNPMPEDYNALEGEKDNLLSAAEEAFNFEYWESIMLIAYFLAGTSVGMLRVRGYWEVAILLCEQGLKAATEIDEKWFIGALANSLGSILLDRGDFTHARKYYEQAVLIAQQLHEEQGLAATLLELGKLAQNQGELEEARRLYDESLEINKKLGDQRDVAITLHQLGNVAYLQGELNEARRLYDESLEIKKRLGDLSGVAITLHQLGMLAQDQGNMEEARRLYGESLEIKKRLGDQSGVAITLHQLGRLAEDEGDKKEAVRLFREALSIFEKLGSPNAEIARRSLARVEGESS